MKGRAILKENSEGLWLCVYISMILFVIGITLTGRVYIQSHSEKQQEIVRLNAIQYKSLSVEGKYEEAAKELKNTSGNALAFLHNLILDQMVFMIVSGLGMVPIAICKFIKSEICERYLTLAKVCALCSLVALIINIKGTLDQIDVYNQLYGYYIEVFNTLSKIV